jgi:hypothetical protein
MPFSYNLPLPLFNDLPQMVQFGRVHPAGFGKFNRLKPELRESFPGFNMDVRRFETLEAKEEKAIRALPKYDRHTLTAVPAPRNR